VFDIRLMRADDVPHAERMWDHAYRTLLVENHLPTAERTPEFVEMHQRRMQHLRGTDPLGSWVAEAHGEVVAVAQAHLRGDRFVLATLGVRPDLQERGLGRELLARTLDFGRVAPLGAIFSSPDPRAIHRYSTAGFELHPTVVAFGPARKVTAAPYGIAVGSERDLDRVDAVDREVRGSMRTDDIRFTLTNGFDLLVDGERGYAVVRTGTVAMLAARDEESATRLLTAAIARCPHGDPVNVSWITSRQQWAVRALVKSGVPLFVHEAVMIRGPWEPQQPYLASGIFG